jgi:hypothetical protein
MIRKSDCGVRHRRPMQYWVLHAILGIRMFLRRSNVANSRRAIVDRYSTPVTLEKGALSSNEVSTTQREALARRVEGKHGARTAITWLAPQRCGRLKREGGPSIRFF